MSGARPKDAARVLLVEDYDDTREMMRMLLQMKGCRVVEAADGQAAIEAAEEHCADLDLVLMDLNLPILSGYEATRRILTHDALRRVPVVAFSAQCHGDRRQRALDAGCRECLPKPVDFDVLDDVLARYCPA
jgi:CheY-like chemotaxis protein